MSDTSRLNLALLPADSFALIAANYSLEGLIELAKNPTAPSAQDPLLFSDGKRLGLDSNALAQKLRLQPNEKELIRTGALQVLQEHLQVLIQNNVRLMGKPDQDEPHLIFEQTLQEQKREIAALLIYNNRAISPKQKAELNTAASIKGTYVGDIIEIDALLNDVNMALVQPRLDDYEAKPVELQQYLRLSHQLRLTRLPEAFMLKLQNYPELTTLDLSFSQLTTLPDSFGNLVGLTRLSMGNNQLYTLPESFGSLVGLTELDLTNNSLFITLPDSFGNLAGLTSLLMANNQLTTLPNSFGNLVGLTELNIDHNRLISLPDSFGSLVRLTQLSMFNNKLRTLPESFGSLVGLTELDLMNNSLFTLPDSFGNLVGLTRLSMANNQLYTLPDSFGGLVALTDLVLQNNQLTTLPDSFGNLVGLTTLWMLNNPFISLPESIRQVLIQTKRKEFLTLLVPVPAHMDELDDGDISAAAATYTPGAATVKKQEQKRKAEEENASPENSAAAEEKPSSNKKQK